MAAEPSARGEHVRVTSWSVDGSPAGFVEFDRYVLPGESAEWVDLRLAGLSS